MNEIREYFDSFTLILIGRFNQPHIPLTVFLRNSLFDGSPSSFLKVLKSFDELMIIMRINIRTDHERSGGGVKNLVICVNEINTVFIIVLQGPN